MTMAVSDALKRIERAMGRLARATPLNSQVLQPIEQELEMGLALAREEWRRDQTVKERLNRLIERAEGWDAMITNCADVPKDPSSLPQMLRHEIRAALSDLRYSEDIGYGDTLDDDIKARTR